MRKPEAISESERVSPLTERMRQDAAFGKELLDLWAMDYHEFLNVVATKLSEESAKLKRLRGIVLASAHITGDIAYDHFGKTIRGYLPTLIEGPGDLAILIVMLAKRLKDKQHGTQTPERGSTGSDTLRTHPGQGRPDSTTDSSGS